MLHSGTMCMGLASMEPKTQEIECGARNGMASIYSDRIMKIPGFACRTFWKVGREDPRRVIHAFKVGLSLTLVSLLYLLEPLFDGVGQNAIWALMTVVVVLEFTAGATLCKGLNRGLGTILAGSLAFFIGFIANQCSQVVRAVFVASSVFLIACVDQYFKDTNSDTSEEEEDISDDDPIYQLVLDSKVTDETLALYASWEPCNSRYCFRFPWKQYVKVGTVLRHFGYTVVALHGCLRTEIQTPKAVRALFKEPSIRVAAEVSKVLRELSNSIRNHRHCSPSILSDNLHDALKSLDTALKAQPRLFLTPTLTSFYSSAGRKPTSAAAIIPTSKTDNSALTEWRTKKDKGGDARMLRPTLSKMAITSLEFAEALPFAAFASLLVETVARLDMVIEEVEELGRVANFKEYVKGDDKVVVVDCGGNGDGGVNFGNNGLRNHLPSHGCE
ncbi:hypothetical protein KSS87_009659 [Heliosperma pusillum]|nr:hypothetical protein KSS87_009659 [Heliosperma pusillum]